jgi:hypothetical protein
MDFAIIYLLVPQPGTPVYEIFKQEGLINLEPYMDPHSDEWYKISITYCNGFRTKHFTNEQLQAELSRAYRLFIIHKLITPRTYINLIRKIRSWEDLRYMLGLLHYPFNMVLAMLKGIRLSNNSIRGAHHGELHNIEKEVLTSSAMGAAAGAEPCGPNSPSQADSQTNKN